MVGHKMHRQRETLTKQSPVLWSSRKSSGSPSTIAVSANPAGDLDSVLQSRLPIARRNGGTREAEGMPRASLCNPLGVDTMVISYDYARMRSYKPRWFRGTNALGMPFGMALLQIASDITRAHPHSAPVHNLVLTLR